MRRRILAPLLLSVLLASCAGRANQNPQPPPLTPEQKFDIAKIGAQTAAVGLAVAILDAQKDPVKNAAQIKYLKLSKAILDEFNTQVADIAVIDLATRAGVKTAIDKGLSGFDNLLAGEFLSLDQNMQTTLRAVIVVARGALASFDVLIPATAPPQ